MSIAQIQPINKFVIGCPAVCGQSVTISPNLLTGIGLVLLALSVYKLSTTRTKLPFLIISILMLLVTIFVTISYDICTPCGYTGTNLKFQLLPPQLSHLLPSPTLTPPPLSQSYFKCQTGPCKEILKNQDIARVIVGVKLPRPTPANWPQDPKLEQQFKQDISQAISQVLQQLKPETQKSARPFEFIPFFALTADQETLDFLDSNPLVTSIEKDEPVAPLAPN